MLIHGCWVIPGLLGRLKYEYRPESVMFYSRLKGYGYKKIHMKLITVYQLDMYPADSLKYWVRKEDSGLRDPTDVFKSSRPLSDISAAVSTALAEWQFGLRKSRAAQLRVSRELVKRTLVDVLVTKKFSLRLVSHALTSIHKTQHVDDSQICSRCSSPVPRTYFSTSSPLMRVSTIGPMNTHRNGLHYGIWCQLGR
jgi:hypothetical protein